MVRDNFSTVAVTSGDRSIFRTLVAGTRNKCQRIAVIGDSQVASPGGSGTFLSHRLMSASFHAFGPPSESMAYFALSQETDFGGSSTSLEFPSLHPSSPVELPTSPIRTQSGTTYGQLNLLTPRSE